MQVDERYLSLFWYWIREREAIRLRKEAGDDHPWSKDQILNTYHFCNVRREDDRGTKELRAVVRKYLNGVSVEKFLPWAYTLARLFNKSETLDLILRSDGEWWEELKCLQDSGIKIFHTAYLVSTCGMSMSKVDYVYDLAKHVAKLSVPRTGLQAAHTVLMSINGLGSFMAGQVVADLRNDRYLTPASVYEATHWSAWGPGSKKGLNLIFGPGTQPGTYQARIMELYKVMPADINNMGIHAQDLQNCLCEFSKYIRHLDNLGGRNRYYEGK